jgi:hypothetical protein
MTIPATLLRTLGGAVAACACAALVSAPSAPADTDPVVPYGTSPRAQTPVAAHSCNDDEADTSAGSIDLPF